MQVLSLVLALISLLQLSCASIIRTPANKFSGKYFLQEETLGGGVVTLFGFGESSSSIEAKEAVLQQLSEISTANKPIHITESKSRGDNIYGNVLIAYINNQHSGVLDDLVVKIQLLLDQSRLNKSKLQLIIVSSGDLSSKFKDLLNGLVIANNYEHIQVS